MLWCLPYVNRGPFLEDRVVQEVSAIIEILSVYHEPGTMIWICMLHLNLVIVLWGKGLLLPPFHRWIHWDLISQNWNLESETPERLHMVMVVPPPLFMYPYWCFVPQARIFEVRDPKPFSFPYSWSPATETPPLIQLPHMEPTEGPIIASVYLPFGTGSSWRSCSRAFLVQSRTLKENNGSKRNKVGESSCSPDHSLGMRKKVIEHCVGWKPTVHKWKYMWGSECVCSRANCWNRQMCQWDDSYLDLLKMELIWSNTLGSHFHLIMRLLFMHYEYYHRTV